MDFHHVSHARLCLLCAAALSAHHALASSCRADSAFVSPDSVKSSSAVRRVADGVIRLAETVLDALTIERPGYSLALYPAASYSGRSGLALGVMPLLQLRSHRLPHPATLTPVVLISTKRMFEVQCDADVYLPHRVDLTAKFEAYKQPDDLYEVGSWRNKSSIARYDFSRRMFTFEALKGLGESGPWRLGLTADVDYYSFSDIEPSSPQVSSRAVSLARSGSGASYGLGAVGGYDSRDNVLAPANGFYTRVSALAYGRKRALGGAYGLAVADVRHYWPLPLSSVMAAQVYIGVGWGDVPFTKMPTCGGTRLGRAIGHNLKYVDRAAWLAQAEWRVPLFWRVGATAFGAVGNVASQARFAFSDVHVMCGAGLRLAVFPGKGLNLRLDGGISNYGDKAIYFNVREAF